MAPLILESLVPNILAMLDAVKGFNGRAESEEGRVRPGRLPGGCIGSAGAGRVGAPPWEGYRVYLATGPLFIHVPFYSSCSAVEERLQLEDQRREVRLGSVPEDLPIDAEVFVDHDVAHIAHVGPVDIR